MTYTIPKVNSHIGIFQKNLGAHFKRFMSFAVNGSKTASLQGKFSLFEADPSMYLASGTKSKILSFVRHAEGIHNAVDT